MATFVLDTDILSLHQRNHPRVGAAIVSHASDVLSISTITIEEQIGGWSALARSAKAQQQHEHAKNEGCDQSTRLESRRHVEFGSAFGLPLNEESGLLN